jgi:hypothetical protein
MTSAKRFSDAAQPPEARTKQQRREKRVMYSNVVAFYPTFLDEDPAERPHRRSNASGCKQTCHVRRHVTRDWSSWTLIAACSELDTEE